VSVVGKFYTAGAEHTAGVCVHDVSHGDTGLGLVDVVIEDKACGLGWWQGAEQVGQIVNAVVEVLVSVDLC